MFRMKSESRNRTIVGNRTTTVHVGSGCPEIAAMIAADKYMPRKNNSNPRNTKNPSSLLSTGHFVVSAGAITHCPAFSDPDGHSM
jgi:hypothetical protein